MDIDELQSSELGTKSFWDEQYETELENFLEFGDVGEIWFGGDIMNRIVTWVNNNVTKSDGVMDLGCGNGIMLITLANKGFSNLTGIDYSEAAIKLASTIAESKQINAQYETCDLFETASPTAAMRRKYRLIIDKGTFDTISLYSEAVEDRKLEFIQRVDEILEKDGFFLLATCNWTEEEIKKYMEKRFRVLAVIPTPVFKFGGKVGNKVTIIVFKKIENTIA